MACIFYGILVKANEKSDTRIDEFQVTTSCPNRLSGLNLLYSEESLKVDL